MGTTSSDFLTTNGRKFLEKELEKLNLELKNILKIPKHISRDEANSREISNNQNAILIQNKILDCEKKLMLPVKKVWEQDERVFHGNGVEVLLNRIPYYLVMDGVCVRKHKLPQNHAIIGSNTPLGMAILSKKVGDHGSYRAGNQTIDFNIKKIHMPSKAKWIFKYDEPVREIKQVEEKAYVYVNA